jgi:hypothetical protein
LSSRPSHISFGSITFPAFMALSLGCSITEESAAEDGEHPGLPAPTIIRADPQALDSEQRRRHDEVERYLAARYREHGWRIIETTQTYGGDVVDWLDPTSVPGSQIEPPPKPSPEELQTAPGASRGLTEFDMYPELRGPEGTVPLLRPSFARYVQGETEASSVEDFIRRHHVPGMPAGQKRLYAGLGKVVANKGATSWVNAFGGSIESETLSLLEMAVVCRGPDPGTTHEQVGIAASRDRHIYFDSLVRLQVEFMTAGDQVTGNQIGGWHPFFSGFIAAAGSPYPVGAVLAVSAVGGSQYEHPFTIQQSGGDWWVAYNGSWLGYYPGSLFNLINVSACEALWYGEVYDPTPTSWTWTDMGSGLFASAGYGNASYFRNPSYVATSGSSYWADGTANLSPNAAACYTRTTMLSGAAPFTRYFYLGGPGGEAPGCD